MLPLAAVSSASGSLIKKIHQRAIVYYTLNVRPLPRAALGGQHDVSSILCLLPYAVRGVYILYCTIAQYKLQLTALEPTR